MPLLFAIPFITFAKVGEEFMWVLGACLVTRLSQGGSHCRDSEGWGVFHG